MTPKEKHIQQDQDFLQTCKALTDALYNYLTIGTRQCISTHTDPEELIKGTEYRDHIQEQIDLLELQLSNCTDEGQKNILSFGLSGLRRQMKQCEEDLAMIQVDLEKGI